MKTVDAITIVRLMISFLLLAITTSDVVAGQKNAVLDVNGNEVKANASYFMVARGPLGGRLWSTWITQNRMNTTNGFLCVKNVLMMTSTAANNEVIPVKFLLSSDIVRVSTELNIRFTMLSTCSESGLWIVADGNSSSAIKEVFLTGSQPSNDTTFTLTQYRRLRQYKIAFGSADKPQDVGIQYIANRTGVAKLIVSKERSFRVSFLPLS